MARVLIVEDLWRPLPDWFQEQYEVSYDPAMYKDPTQIYQHKLTAKALIIRNQTQVDADFLDQLPQLQVIGRLGVGLDNVDLSACKERRIDVISARGFNANAVAEYVLAAMFERARFLRTCDARTKQGLWQREQGVGSELSGKTLGLIGVGDIGQRVALRARALAMDVLACDPLLMDSHLLFQDGVAKLVEMEHLLRHSDFISIHVPLLPTTRHLIATAQLDLMKDDVTLINTARGGIVDETALLNSLCQSPERFAVLDVREQEPPLATSALNGLTNVLLTPHIAGVTRESSRRVADFILRQVSQKLQGLPFQGGVGF